MKKFFKILIWTLVLAVFVGTFVYLYLSQQAKPAVYNLVAPSYTTIQRSSVLTGAIEPRDEIEIKPQISGIISSIEVEAGDRVVEGDIIARIKVVPDESSLSSAKSRISTAEISLADAQTRHDRNTALYEKKVISREEFESTQTEVEKAKEELKAAKDAYAIVKEGVSPDNATASNTLVRATTSGLVLDVPVKVGASVIQANTFNDGTTIATVADMNKLIFKGNVDETEVGNLYVGQQMDVTIGALPDLRLEALIEYISPKSSSSSGASTFEIKGAVEVPDSVFIRSGYSANAAVILQRVTDVLSVPEGVIEFKGDSTFVYVLTDSVIPQKFERTAIRTGLSDGINVQVLDGIASDVRLKGSEVSK